MPVVLFLIFFLFNYLLKTISLVCKKLRGKCKGQGSIENGSKRMDVDAATLTWCQANYYEAVG